MFPQTSDEIALNAETRTSLPATSDTAAFPVCGTSVRRGLYGGTLTTYPGPVHGPRGVRMGGCAQDMDVAVAELDHAECTEAQGHRAVISQVDEYQAQQPYHYEPAILGIYRQSALVCLLVGRVGNVRSRILRFSLGADRFRRSVGVLGNLLWIFANLAVCAVGAWENRSGHPVLINQAYSVGIQMLTQNRFTPGSAIETLILLSMLASIRCLVIRFRIYFGNGPVEVRPLDDASGVADLDTHRLDVAFREYLTLPRLYQVTTVPGDPDPDQIIEILRPSAHSGWRQAFAAAYAYAIPRRAFVVSATLRTRNHPLQRYGVLVQVKKLPGFSIELESQWSSSFERALQRAAYAVGAYILPNTRHCRNVPWSEWRGRLLPATLFRDYLRAKAMVNERRYDEALALYQRALLQDANNVGIRYDIGQLCERLRLHPDALRQYLQLANEIFPVRSRNLTVSKGAPRVTEGKADPRRTAHPRWWPERARDPFVIRYRYVVVLGSGSVLAQELCAPDWVELRAWIDAPGEPGQQEDRPARVIELTDIRRLLSQELDDLFPSLADQASAEPGQTLLRLIDADTGRVPASNENGRRRSARRRRPGQVRPDRAVSILGEGKAEPDSEQRRLWAVEKYLLQCALREASALEEDFKHVEWRNHVVRGRRSSLTLTSVRQASLTIRYRLDRLLALSGQAPATSWPHSLAIMQRDLQQVGYIADRSTSWLEHYNAACLYALTLMNSPEKEGNAYQTYAVAAVSALQRALGCGEDVDFARAKRYWLQAGDPDLAGLRNYSCFQAFQSRIYGRPLPAATDIAKYELYLFLRAILEAGARSIEREWRRRISETGRQIPSHEFERWWQQEVQAWELAVRLGRFYRQWQTRRLAVDGLRDWQKLLGKESYPVPYPDLVRTDYLPDFNGYEKSKEKLASTEEIFKFLGRHCGRLEEQTQGRRKTPLDDARSWAEYARYASRAGEIGIDPASITDVFLARASLWAALRHWAYSPSAVHQAAFQTCASRLVPPPRLHLSVKLHWSKWKKPGKA
jgi:hypothetical protein